MFVVLPINGIIMLRRGRNHTRSLCETLGVFQTRLLLSSLLGKNCFRFSLNFFFYYLPHKVTGSRESGVRLRRVIEIRFLPAM